MVRNDNSFLTKYILNTSFHGFRYIAEPNRHWTERVFWILCCTLSWWASGILIRSAWKSHQNNAISFVVETSYSDWDTEFPSVAVCEVNNDDKIADFANEVYGDPHDFDFDEIIRELVFYSPGQEYTLQICGPKTLHTLAFADPNNIVKNCFKKNLSDFSLGVRSTCKELFRTCKWNKVEFDCCKNFVMLKTDMGFCYTINSQQIGIKNPPRYKMTSNRSTGPGSLRLELNSENNVYILGPLEVPSIETSSTDYISVAPHTQARRSFTVKDIENQDEVRDLSIHQRKCRFAEENYLDVFPYYSYSACLMQCMKDAQLKKCGCAHHLMPNTPLGKQCNYTGLACLNANYQEVMVQKSPISTKLGLVCDCLSSCTEIHVSTITDNKLGFEEEYSIVELSLERLPTERYKRNVVNGKLLLAVSIGSATALFLGASFLSFAEIIFYFLVRPVSDYFREQHKEEKRWNTINHITE